jgi:uncharacterized protein
MANRITSRVTIGSVMHRRHQPFEHHFEYPVFFLLINLDELYRLDGWLFGINRRRPLAFNFRDHGDASEPRSWAAAVLARHGISDCNGPIWLQTFPRVLGYLFNPVSFWYCHRDDGSVGAIIAEVNNTFGDRHCYVLQADAQGRFRGVAADKAMYVSPFYPVEGRYRFHFNLDFDAPRVRIDYFDAGKLQLNTAVWGVSRPLSSASLASALLRQPLLTVGVIARIHWQALRLWLKGATLFQRTATTAREAKP